MGGKYSRIWVWPLELKRPWIQVWVYSWGHLWHALKVIRDCSRLSVVQFGVALGTLCLNLNPEVQLRFGCKPSTPEVQNLICAKYGKRSQKNFPAKSLNLGYGLGVYLVLEVHKPDCRQSRLWHEYHACFSFYKMCCNKLMVAKALEVDINSVRWGQCLSMVWDLVFFQVQVSTPPWLVDNLAGTWKRYWNMLLKCCGTSLPTKISTPGVLLPGWLTF